MSIKKRLLSAALALALGASLLTGCSKGADGSGSQSGSGDSSSDVQAMDLTDVTTPIWPPPVSPGTPWWARWASMR